MDSLEAIQLPPSNRTFWNSSDPTLDPFDETLVLPTMASPLEACSSTFLFPSTPSSTCDVDSDDSQVFLHRPSQLQQQHTIFDDIAIEGGAESRGVVTGSSNTSNSMESYHHSSQFSWLSALPQLYHPQSQGVERASSQGQGGVPLNHIGGAQLVPEFFRPGSTQVGSTTSTTALRESGHGSENQTAFVKVPPLMRHPTFRPPDAGQQRQQLGAWAPPKQLNVAKASWQSAGSMFSEPSRRVVSPLGSPCSVISGFTKVVDQFVTGSDYNNNNSSNNNMEISSCSFGPTTSHDEPAAHPPAHAGKYVASRYYNSHSKSHPNSQPDSQESVPASAPVGGAQSMSAGTQEMADGVATVPVTSTKRKRARAPKHGNEVESQRMTHIAVERNRRKQMNEHLATLRALMPGSYVQKGDQASVVGGAIEFVKELEHLLHCLEAQKRRRAYNDISNAGTPTSRLAMPNPEPQFGQTQPPFTFHSPQRLVDQSPFLVGAPTENSLSAVSARPGVTSNNPTPQQQVLLSSSSTLQGVTSMDPDAMVGEARSDMASVEVKLVGTDAALVKVMALRRAGQLLRTVVALESLALTILHANITTVGHTVLYSFHVQIGPPCRMNVDEIARALHQTFGSLHALQF